MQPAPARAGSLAMRARSATTCWLGLALCAVVAVGQGSPPERQLDAIRLPPGFTISVYAEGVGNARSLALSDSGIIYVGTRRPNSDVFAVVDNDGDMKADEVKVVARGLNFPNGVAWRDGSLYVAEISRVLRYDDIDNRLHSPPEPVVILDTMPSERHHGWKFIRFGPDGRLYTQIGAPCNICDEGDPYATIVRMNADGSDFEVFARGIRNTVGFDWHPQSGALWFTDNGRDMMGDDIPPDELNRITEAGQHFGYPYCHGDDIADPDFGDRRACSEFVAPAMNLGPHVAAIGMRFYRGRQFPAEYRDRILFAEHGSWNRSEKSGYRVMMVTVDDQGRATDYRPFAEGWLQGKTDWGRPVDVEVLADGSLIVSDDKQGVLYRISYDAGAAASR